MLRFLYRGTPGTAMARVLLLACVTLTLVPAANQQIIYSVKPRGELNHYQYQGMDDGAASWGALNVVAGNDWNLRHVFSGADRVMFAISDTGDLFYYKYSGVSNGAKSWSKTHVQ